MSAREASARVSVAQSLEDWLEGAYDAKVVLDTDGAIQLANRRAEALFAREHPLVGTRLAALAADGAALGAYLGQHVGLARPVEASTSC